MTDVTGTRYYDGGAYSAGSPRKAVPQNILGAAALGCIALACAWTLYANVSGGSSELVTASLPPAAFISSVEPADRIAAAYEALRQMPAPQAVQATREARATVNARTDDPAARARTALLYGPRFLGPQPGTFRPLAEPAQAAQEIASLPAQAGPETLPLPQPHQVAAVVPTPAPRPAELRQLQAAGPSRREVAQANAPAALEPEPEPKKPSIFERLFGKSASDGLQLAFAAPDGGVTSDGESLTLGRIPQYDQFTAVYDISARTVYLPDGTKLEAHSGLGKMMDDPRYADRKMRGVTPPHTYELSLRERPFHGVEAIRLKPVGGEDKIYGRTGLLAHTYMLGPNGASNGCVSFKNYTAFLRAYKSGRVRRMVVVAKL
ncbi:tlde1 domain-containing protein [Nitrobacter sp. NHB1]|uniref:tlde1 domain-containing protein n=1 Tax=Nitrobacter sp. NHB1 TaxID=3119830 RepID=UPI002FFFE619